MHEACRSDTLQGKVRNKGKTWRWKDDDSYIFICKCVSRALTLCHLTIDRYRVASLDVDDESNINWKSLSDPTWDMWSSHFLQQKWRSLKASSNLNGVVRHRGEYKTLILPMFSALHPR
jgi:hypothetical protein